MKGVVTKGKILVNPIETHIEEWMSTIKVIRTSKKVSEVFFSIITKNGFSTLIKNQIELLKQ